MYMYICMYVCICIYICMYKVLKENERLTSACGSPHYCSPEILDGNSEGSVGYRLECDVWAVGVIAYSLLCCQVRCDVM